METNEEEIEILKTTELPLGQGVVHHGGRHMKMIKDGKGIWWLCDQTANPKLDLQQQGCWSCDKVIFTRGG